MTPPQARQGVLGRLAHPGPTRSVLQMILMACSNFPLSAYLGRLTPVIIKQLLVFPDADALAILSRKIVAALADRWEPVIPFQSEVCTHPLSRLQIGVEGPVSPSTKTIWSTVSMFLCLAWNG
jgi:hypothetical protein